MPHTDTSVKNKVSEGKQKAAGKQRPGGSRRLWRLCVGALVGIIALTAILYGPSQWANYQNAKLKRLSLPELEGVVKQQPQNVNALYSLGLAYSRDNRHLDATRAFLAVLDKDPVRADVLNDLGVSYLFQQRYYESLVAFQGALSVRPDYAPACANMGRLHLATKMPFSAVTELEKAVKLEGNNVAALCDLGEAYQQTLNLKGAQTIYQRALQSDPNSLPACVGLGKTLYSLGNYDEAEKSLNTALKLSPDNSAALIALGRLRLERAANSAEVEGASALFTRAIQSDAEDPEGWYNLGRALLRQNKPTLAVEKLAHALQLSPQHQSAMHEMERALRLSGRISDADRVGQEFQRLALRDREETHLEEHIAHAPQDWDAKVRLALSYTQSGNRGMALLLYRQVKENAPQTPQLPALQQALNRQAAMSAPVR